MTAKLRKYVLPNLPYVFIGILLGNIGEAYRLAAGVDVGNKIIGMIATIPAAFESILPGPFLLEIGRAHV